MEKKPEFKKRLTQNKSMKELKSVLDAYASELNPADATETPTSDRRLFPEIRSARGDSKTAFKTIISKSDPALTLFSKEEACTLT